MRYIKWKAAEKFFFKVKVLERYERKMLSSKSLSVQEEGLPSFLCSQGGLTLTF
jgi:hypothetical protein